MPTERGADGGEGGASPLGVREVLGTTRGATLVVLAHPDVPRQRCVKARTPAGRTRCA